MVLPSCSSRANTALVAMRAGRLVSGGEGQPFSPDAMASRPCGSSAELRRSGCRPSLPQGEGQHEGTPDLGSWSRAVASQRFRWERHADVLDSPRSFPPIPPSPTNLLSEERGVGFAVRAQLSLQGAVWGDVCMGRRGGVVQDAASLGFWFSQWRLESPRRPGGRAFDLRLPLAAAL